MASPDMIGYPLFILLDHHFLNFFFFFLLQSVESSTVERRGDYDRTSRSDFRDGADDGEERVLAAVAWLFPVCCVLWAAPSSVTLHCVTASSRLWLLPQSLDNQLSTFPIDTYLTY